MDIIGYEKYNDIEGRNIGFIIVKLKQIYQIIIEVW